MKTVPADDLILADTPHARLMRDALRSGTLAREPRFERMVEAMVVILTKREDKRKMAEGCKAAAEAGRDMMLRYAEFMTDDEALEFYDQIHGVLEIRLRRLLEPEKKEVESIA